jgi:hypothetical protein
MSERKSCDDVQLGPVALDAEDQIIQSLALPRSAAKQRERRQFWYGFIAALLGSGLISRDEYAQLRDKADNAN